MSFKETMEKRYTTKLYNPSKKIDQSIKNDLKNILHLSPSSINSQPWQFSFISDNKIKNELAEASFFNKERIQNADTLVVFSRINSLEKFEKQIKEELPQGAVDYYNQFIKTQSEEQIKAWFSMQVYLALGVFLSACAEMGIDATPMEGVEPEKYDSILNQTDYTTLFAVSIGYRDNDDFNQPDKKPKSRIDINKVIKTL